MSKASRARKRIMRLAREAEMKAKGNSRQQQELPIITGSFEQRASEVIKRDNENRMDKYPDSRLPIHYGGNGHYISNGPVKYDHDYGNDTGYRPINHEADKKIFNIKSSDITEGTCPIAKIPKVYVTARLWNEWIALAEDYSTEWLAYLTGQFVKDDKGARYEIRKMYFPPQVAHATHVDVDDDFENYLPNTIGAIHSHVQMGVFFSGEDLSHSNWPVEIVVNAKGECKVMIRHQLECGNWIKNYSEILTVGDSAGEKYITSLDKAFEAGESLRQQRVAKKGDSVGYRTPQPSYVTDYTRAASPSPPSPPPSNGSNVTYEKDKEWKFRINGKAHGWRGGEVDGEWVEMVKVEGKWLFIDDPILGSSQVKVSVPDATGDSVNTNVSIDQQTGQISDDGSAMDTRPATQEELDRILEQEVDDASCVECGGLGKLDNFINGIKVGVVECAVCGGSGWKPGRYMGYEGYTC